jgi:hypothetical protein
MKFFKSGCIGISCNWKKLLFVIIYATIASILGFITHREILALLPLDAPFHSIIEKAIVPALALFGVTGLVFLISLIGKFQEWKHRKDFLRIGLKNGLNETPQRLAKRRDKTVKRGYIVIFDNVRICTTEFDKKTAELNNIFNAGIYRYEYNKSLRKTLVYMQKHKKVKVGEVYDDEV